MSFTFLSVVLNSSAARRIRISSRYSVYVEPVRTFIMRDMYASDSLNFCDSRLRHISLSQ